jgi:hypothetical protein
VGWRRHSHVSKRSTHSGALTPEVTKISSVFRAVRDQIPQDDQYQVGLWIDTENAKLAIFVPQEGSSSTFRVAVSRENEHAETAEMG